MTSKWPDIVDAARDVPGEWIIAGYDVLANAASRINAGQYRRLILTDGKISARLVRLRPGDARGVLMIRYDAHE